MAFETDSLAFAAFKRMIGKTHTGNVKEPGGEAVASSYTLAAARIMSETIPLTAPSSSTDSIIVCATGQAGELELIADSSSNGKAYFATIPTGHPLLNYINPTTGVNYTDNSVGNDTADKVQRVLPQSFGNSYRPILKDNGAEVPSLDASDWFLDEFAGVVVSETNLSLGSTGTLACYVYVGQSVQDSLDNLQVPGRFTFTIQSGVSWDNSVIPVYQLGETYPIQITKVKATVMGISTPTLTFNLEERNDGSLNSSGVDILAPDLIADADGAETTSFTNPSQEVLEVNDFLVFTTGVSAESGTVNSITCTVFYNTIIS